MAKCSDDGGLLLVAVVAVALSDVIRTFGHLLDLSFLRDVGGNVPGMAGVGAAGAGAAGGAASGGGGNDGSRQDPQQALRDLDQSQADYYEHFPREATPADTPQSEWDKFWDKFWKAFWHAEDR